MARLPYGRAIAYSPFLLFGHVVRLARLVLRVDARATFACVSLPLLLAFVPLALAYVGKLLVDAVVLEVRDPSRADPTRALEFVALECAIMLFAGLLSRAHGFAQGLLGAKLGHAVQISILEKAETLELEHFERPSVYDALQTARRDAGTRPMQLFASVADIAGNIVTLATHAVVLATLTAWMLPLLVIASVPAFIVETRFSARVFELFASRAETARRMQVLEGVLTKAAHVEEAKLYRLGPFVLGRHRALFAELLDEERGLAARRAIAGFVLGSVATVAIYGCYAWIVVETIAGALTLGDMTMMIAVFRQGQTALRGVLRALGAACDHGLYVGNLFSFLDTRVDTRTSTPTISSADAEVVAGKNAQTTARDGFVLDAVSFRYPGTRAFVLEEVSLHIGRREKIGIVGANGAGKSTLIRLLTRLHAPTSGSISLDGTPLDSISRDALSRRMGIVFQNFVRHPWTAGENIGIGDIDAVTDRARVERAATRGGAMAVLESLPHGQATQLGRAFRDGVELSGGDWQKVAVSRAFMPKADIFIFDEPAASLDPEAELALVDRMRGELDAAMVLVISHRLSALRRFADRIVVLEAGRVVEDGSHAELMAQDGRYAELFRMQARGYIAE